jgi:heat shock protein HslJ
VKKFLLLAAILITAAVVSCKSGPNFSDVAGKEWLLTDVRLNGKSINFDRNTLILEGFGDIFTLNFEVERLGGTGAPNRYFAPYTLGSNQAIKVETVAETLMAPLRQPEKLKEHDFFTYIQNASKWNLVKNNLELVSKGEDSSNVVLVFITE